MNISADVRSNFAEMVAIRRAIHRYPEQGFKEKRTAALIRARLKAYGVEHKPLCGTGVVAIVRGAKPGPTMLIRADMDGLPILEENKVPYASRNRGVMHA
jgi:amidohydrolase